MDNPTTQPSDDMELLVAYLDGELSGEELERIEDRLATDPSLRNELRQLQQSWDLLDQLPKTTASNDFTQTTVEVAVVDADQELLRASPAHRRRRWLSWISGFSLIATGLLAGYLTSFSFANRANQQLLRELPLIENVRLYRAVDNIEFLKALKSEKLFTEEINSESP